MAVQLRSRGVLFSFASGDEKTIAACGQRHLGFKPGLKADHLRSLLRTTALTSTLVIASVLTAPKADAANECGPLAASITCTSAGNTYPTGIAYDPVGSFTLIVDPTVVIDTTGSGFNGISIPTSGNPLPNGDIVVNVATGASITTDQYGISVYVDSGSVTIDNGAAITAGADGIRTLSYGGGSDITITNDGAINAGDNGIYATTSGATAGITIVNSGDIDGGDFPPAYSAGIYAITNGNGSGIGITNSGNLDSIYGVFAIANGSDVNIAVTNTGDITAVYAGITTLAYGANSTTLINNSGDVVSVYGGVQGFSDAAYSNVTVINSGNITVTSNVLRGLGGRTNGDFSDVTIINYGDINSAGDAISLRTGGIGSDISATNSGSLTAGGRGISIRTFGAGDIIISNDGAVTAATDGIYAFSTGNGSDITISNAADIQAGNFGITAEVSGSGTIAITNAQSSVIESFDAGINAVNNNGNISIVNSGSITTTIADYYAGGIEARSFGADNNITITNLSTAVVTAQASAGIYAANTADGATINITNNGTVTSSGYYAGGIIAFNGNGTATVDNFGLVTTTNDFAQGIVGFTQGGTVDLLNSGTVITSGYGSAGIISRPNIGFDGTIIVENTGTIITSGAFAYGIETKGSGGGSQTVTNSGSIQTSGDNANAIDARSRLLETSSANIFITNAGQGALTSRRANGIYAAARNGTIAVANNGSINAFTNGIFAIADNNSVTIENSGLIVTTGPDGAGIAVTSATGSVINNLAGGVISPNSGSLFAINAKGAAVAVNNAGIIIGRVDLTGNSDVFANLTGGAFEARLTSDFGGGDDGFNNTGTVHTANNAAVGEATAFINLENFNNSGLVSLIDGGTGDSFTLSGNFNAGSGTLGLDAFLGGPGSPADLFIVGGNVTGQTAVVINNTNPNDGVFNEVGITVITVNGSVDESAFALQDGPIETGFFSYDLFFEPAPGNNSFELRSFVDADGHILPQLLTATQDIWHITSDAWFDRTADLRVLLRGDAPVSLKDPSAPSALMPAIWARGSGEWLTRDAAASTTAFGRTYDFNLDRDLRVGDFQAGIDFGTRGVVERGDALIFGLTGGAIVANLDYKNLGREFDLTGGQIGAYATYLNHNVFIDALLKADFLEIDAESGPLTDTLDATTLGIRVDAGYRFGGKSLFFEPLATLAVSWSDIDSFTSDGNQVEFGDDASVRGRLGFRLGSTMTPWAGVQLEPFVIGSLWSQLEGGNSADLTSTGTTFTLTDDHADVWGEISAGLNVFDAGNSTSAFTKVDVTFGDNIEGIGGQVGMRIKW